MADRGTSDDSEDRHLPTSIGRTQILRALFEHAPIATVFTGLDGRWLEVNRAFCEFVGYTEEELRGKSFLDVTHPDERAENETFAQSLLSGEVPKISREKRYVRKDGSVVWGHMTTTLVHDDAGAPMGFVAQAVDVSERKRALDELGASEARFRTLVTHAPVGIFESNAVGDCVYVNPKWCALTGQTEAEALGRGWQRGMASEDVERVNAAAAAARLLRGNLVVDFQFTTKAGKTLHLMSFASPLLDPAGEISGYLGTLVDVTDRERAMDALARSERNFRALVERAPIGVVINQGRTIQFANAAMARMVGRADASSLIGTDALDLVHPDDRELGADRFRRLDRGEELGERTIRCVRVDGTTVDVAPTTIGVEFDGTLSRLALIRDVTAARRAEAARTEAEQALRASLDDKEVLLKEIHHRVKNNLQVVTSLLHLQAASIADPKARAAFDDTRARVHAIALLHERLYRATNLKSIDLLQYLQGITHELLRAHAGSSVAVEVLVKGAGVELDLDTALPLGLIVNELVTNSLKHAFPKGSRNRGTIDVRITADGEWMTVTVADDGVGVLAGFDAVGKNNLGLSLVAGLARQLDGKVSLKQDKGVQWTVYIPREKNEVNAQPRHGATS